MNASTQTLVDAADAGRKSAPIKYLFWLVFLVVLCIFPFFVKNVVFSSRWSVPMRSR
ncbi:MAG: hypothetical protein R3E68_22770 [Burkholderiaceae bacterium]